MYSYDGLIKILQEKNMKRSELSARLGISSRTIAKIGKGEKLADHVIARLCDFSVVKRKIYAQRFATIKYYRS